MYPMYSCRSRLLGGYIEVAGVVPGQLPRRDLAVPPPSRQTKPGSIFSTLPISVGTPAFS